LIAAWAVTAVGFDSIPYGQSGVEASMDVFLRGEAGYDAFKIWWNDLLTNRPPPGLDIRLTIDSRLQKLAVESIGSRPGVVVAIEATSGEVLTMLSSPAFDPNHLDRDWENLTSRSDAPLLNRAAQGRYQPGMALAPFIMAWAIENNLSITDSPVSNLTSGVSVEGGELICVFSPPEQAEPTLGLALQLGCPRPFADLGQSMGSEGLAALFSAFAFDKAPLIRIDSAQISSIDLPENLREVRWTAVGQGDLTLTPLQVARGFAGLIGDGILPALQLIQAVEDPQGGWQTLRPLDTTKTAISKDVSQSLRDELLQSSGARNGYLAKALSGGDVGSTAWFLGSTVYEQGRIVVVIVLEGAEEHEVEQLGWELLENISSISSSP
jgi:peptidoglycan glycosyltransferase